MLTNRLTLIGISLLVMIGGGVYFSLYPNSVGNGADQDDAPVESANDTVSTSTASTKNCPFETSESPELSPIILNEIAWMGTKKSANDEWIELENKSSSTASMGGWELINRSEKIKVAFRSGAQISAGGFYLLERGSADFLPNIKADNFFTGSLKNDGDSFRLFDKKCGLIDEIISTSSWPAGDNGTKKTMERDATTLLWHTSALAGGTPGAENDQVGVKIVTLLNDQVSMINDQ